MSRTYRYRQGIIPDFMLDATSVDLPENVAKILEERTFAEMKALTPWTTYSESKSTAFSHSAEKRQKIDNIIHSSKKKGRCSSTPPTTWAHSSWQPNKPGA